MNTVEPIKKIAHIREMKEFLKSQSSRNELLFILGINTGLRISDILKLRYEDFMKDKYNIKDCVTIQEKKTKKTKKFYLTQIVKDKFTNYVKEIFKDKSYTPGCYIFKSRKGNGAISREQAYRILNKAGEKIGLVERDANNNIVSGEIGTHTLRKTFGYHAYTSGVSLSLLMQIFNHSSEAQTLRYIGITEENKKDVYLNLNLGM